MVFPCPAGLCGRVFVQQQQQPQQQHPGAAAGTAAAAAAETAAAAAAAAVANFLQRFSLLFLGFQKQR